MLDGRGGDRRLRRLRVLLVPRRRRGGRGRDAVRHAVRAGHDRRGRRQARRLPAAPRRASTSCRRTGSPTGRTSGRCSELGVRRIIGPCAVGRAPAPTSSSASSSSATSSSTGRAGREDTFYDGPETTHVSAADPYCPDLRRAARRDGARARASRCTTAAPSSSSRARASRPAPSRGGSSRMGWDVDQHDRLPGGLPRPRARALLRERLDGHRPRRRRRAAPSRSPATTVVRVFHENLDSPARAPLRRDPEDRPAAGPAPLRDRPARRADHALSVGRATCPRPDELRLYGRW